MKNILLLAITFFTINGMPSASNGFVNQKPCPDFDLPTIIRAGYDQMDDDYTFSQTCKTINDSLLAKKEEMVAMGALTAIYEYNNSIDWTFSYFDSSITNKVSSRKILQINLEAGKPLRVQNNPIQVSDLQRLSRDYIFYPDSLSKRYTNSTLHVEGIGEIEVPFVVAELNVYVNKKHGLPLSDWRVFYECLYELVEMCEDERNKTSLRLWQKEYASLSFEEKVKLAGVAGYNIHLRFYIQ